MQASNQVNMLLLDWSPIQREIAQALRSIIDECSPAIQEVIKYGIPYYQYHGPLCYLSPEKGSVKLGFAKGYLMSNAQEILESHELKQIRHLTFKRIEEVNPEAVHIEIQEALLINEELMKSKKKP